MNTCRFIEEARRRQIIDTAIRLIAGRGISQASLAEIAREAGCSKGVISCHFRGKDELIEAILARLIREPAAFIKQRVDAEKRDVHALTDDEFMARHRMRNSGGMTDQLGLAMRAETWTTATLVSSIDLFDAGTPKRLALTVRLVANDGRSTILWMHGVARAGDQAPGWFITDFGPLFWPLGTALPRAWSRRSRCSRSSTSDITSAMSFGFVSNLACNDCNLQNTSHPS